ncbi:MAG: GntR family transcriptional regulator [Betaproteobacteria bacterium]
MIKKATIAAPKRAAKSPMPEGPAASRKSLVLDTYDLIRRRILDNVYPPGHQALEQELASELGISRTPLREALIRLQNEGLVEVIPRHGMRVLPVSATDMKEIYEILTALESIAAELVVMRKPSERELTSLEAATRDMAKALRTDDLDAWAGADERFHRELIELSGNRMLVQSVLNYWDRAHRARMFTLRLRPKPADSTKEHMALVERIRAGDAAGAFELNRAHRQRGSRELLAILERYRLQQL